MQVERLIALFGGASAEDSEEDESARARTHRQSADECQVSRACSAQLPLLLKHAQRTQRVTQQLLAQLARIVLSALGENSDVSFWGGGTHSPFDRLVTAVRIYRQLEGSHVPMNCCKLNLYGHASTSYFRALISTCDLCSRS